MVLPIPPNSLLNLKPAELLISNVIGIVYMVEQENLVMNVAPLSKETTLVVGLYFTALIANHFRSLLNLGLVKEAIVLYLAIKYPYYAEIKTSL